MGKVIVGLDIGTTKIACFVGRKNEHGKIEILSMGKSESFGVTRGVVSNMLKTVSSIRAAIEEAEGRIEGELKNKLGQCRYRRTTHKKHSAQGYSYTH